MNQFFLNQVIEDLHIGKLYDGSNVDLSNRILNNCPSYSEYSEQYYYYFYIVLDLYSNGFYCGVHATNNIRDNYLGSGTIIRRKVKKHGQSNFQKKILKFFDTGVEMKAFEREVISKEFLIKYSNDCWNLVTGGGCLPKGVTWMQDPAGQTYRVSKELVQTKESQGWSRTGTTAGRVSIHLGKKIKRVLKEDLQTYLNLGYSTGSNVNTTFGKIAMSRGAEKTYVLVENVQQMEALGWSKGFGPEFAKKAQSIHRGRVRVTNEMVTKNIWQKDLESYLKAGWRIGSHLKNNYGKVYMYKGMQNRMFPAQDVEYYKNLGWTIGRISKPRGRGKKVWIVRDGVRKCVLIDQVQNYMQEGWTKGMKKI